MRSNDYKNIIIMIVFVSEVLSYKNSSSNNIFLTNKIANEITNDYNSQYFIS